MRPHTRFALLAPFLAPYVVRLSVTHNQRSPNPSDWSIASLNLPSSFSLVAYAGSSRWLKHVCAVGKRSESSPFLLITNDCRNTQEHPHTYMDTMSMQFIHLGVLATWSLAARAPCQFSSTFFFLVLLCSLEPDVFSFFSSLLLTCLYVRGRIIIFFLVLGLLVLLIWVCGHGY